MLYVYLFASSPLLDFFAASSGPSYGCCGNSSALLIQAKSNYANSANNSLGVLFLVVARRSADTCLPASPCSRAALLPRSKRKDVSLRFFASFSRPELASHHRSANEKREHVLIWRLLVWSSPPLAGDDDCISLGFRSLERRRRAPLGGEKFISSCLLLSLQSPLPACQRHRHLTNLVARSLARSLTPAADGHLAAHSHLALLAPLHCHQMDSPRLRPLSIELHQSA